jgi:hypothetical protein
VACPRPGGGGRDARGGPRPAPRRLPWRGTLTGTGIALVVGAAVRAAPALAGRPGLELGRALEETVGSRPALLYLFHRADCPRHVVLQSRWAALGGSGALTVLGIELDRRIGGAGRPIPDPDPGFPVRRDLRRAAERAIIGMGYSTTPVTILIDGRGRPRLVLPPPTDQDAVRAAAEAVRAALAAM